MNERGSAVVGSLFTITAATLVIVSLLGLSLSAMNVLMIRDAAISATSRAALSEAPSQGHYLLRLLDSTLPQLASFQVEQLNEPGLIGFEVVSRLPGLGFWQPEISRVRVYAAKEQI